MVEICGPSGSVIGPHRGSTFVVDLICGLLVILVSIIVIITYKEAVPDGTAVAAYDSGCPVHAPRTVIVLYYRVHQSEYVFHNTGTGSFTGSPEVLEPV